MNALLVDISTEKSSCIDVVVLVRCLHLLRPQRSLTETGGETWEKDKAQVYSKVMLLLYSKYTPRTEMVRPKDGRGKPSEVHEGNKLREKWVYVQERKRQGEEDVNLINRWEEE